MKASARALESALLKKGFLLERSTTDKIFYLHHQGKKTQIFTKISMGRSEELRDVLCSKIKSQMRLEKSSQLTDFIDCKLTHENYLKFLKDNAHIADPPPKAANG